MKILVIGNVIFSHKLVEYLIKEKFNLIELLLQKKHPNNSDYPICQFIKNIKYYL